MRGVDDGDDEMDEFNNFIHMMGWKIYLWLEVKRKYSSSRYIIPLIT